MSWMENLQLFWFPLSVHSSSFERLRGKHNLRAFIFCVFNHVYLSFSRRKQNRSCVRLITHHLPSTENIRRVWPRAKTSLVTPLRGIPHKGQPASIPNLGFHLASY